VTGLSPDQMTEHHGSAREPFIVVTRGAEDTWIFTPGGRYDIPVVPPERIIDPTGVGDAFRGGFLTGYMHDLDLVTCGRMGALAAAYCLEQRGPQGQTYTLAEFVTRYRRYCDDQEVLDKLLGEKLK